MGWSYRSDRADEVYATTAGPAVAATEQLPRPPVDGEDASSIDRGQGETLPEGETRSVDPEAGPKPPPSTEGMSQEQIQKEKLGPAPAPSAEEQQKAIDAARGTEAPKGGAEKGKPEPAAAKK